MSDPDLDKMVGFHFFENLYKGRGEREKNSEVKLGGTPKTTTKKPHQNKIRIFHCKKKGRRRRRKQL